MGSLNGFSFCKNLGYALEKTYLTELKLPVLPSDVMSLCPRLELLNISLSVASSEGWLRDADFYRRLIGLIDSKTDLLLESWSVSILRMVVSLRLSSKLPSEAIMWSGD